MRKTIQKQQTRARRHGRIRSTLWGTAARPRLAVFRSNRYIYGQVIDDEKGVTLAGLSSGKISGASTRERARAAGKALAEKAREKGVAEVVFDRGGFLYAGSVKAFADGAREGGLKF